MATAELSGVELNTNVAPEEPLEDFSEATVAQAIAEYRSMVLATARGKRDDTLPPEAILLPANRLRKNWTADVATATRRGEFAADLKEADRLTAQAGKLAIPPRVNPGEILLADVLTVDDLRSLIDAANPDVWTVELRPEEEKRDRLLGLAADLRGGVARDRSRTRCPELYSQIEDLNRQISQTTGAAEREAELCREAADQITHWRRVLNDPRTDELQEHGAAGKLETLQSNYPHRRLVAAQQTVKAAKKRAKSLEKDRQKLVKKEPENMRWAD